MTSARRPKNPGPFLTHNHTITPATSAKLIHLKRFSADCFDAEPASSACAVSTRRNTQHIRDAATLAYSFAVPANFRFIAILSVVRSEAASIAPHAGPPAPQTA